MKTSSWFEALALLVISVMSVAAGVESDVGRVDVARATVTIGQR
jgi:hypothetical protein